MKLDFVFLADYFESEISRLGKSARVARLHELGYKNDRDRILEVPQLHRDWQWKRRLDKNEALLDEVHIKLGHIDPKIEKLKEQLEIVKSYL